MCADTYKQQVYIVEAITLPGLRYIFKIMHTDKSA